MKPRAVYVITNLATGKEYIGQTNQPDIRKRQHLKSWSRCLALGAAVKKHGRENFTFKILATGMDRATADAVEKMLIKNKGTLAPGGYNLTEGGEGGKCTDEGRRKISIANKGRKRSAQVCNKFSIMRTGLELRESTNEKIRQKAIARHMNPDFKARHAEAVRHGMAMAARVGI